MKYKFEPSEKSTVKITMTFDKAEWDAANQKAYEQTRGSILIISHQERILNIADKIVVIKDGCIQKTGARQDILPGLLGSADAAQPACDYLTNKVEGVRS